VALFLLFVAPMSKRPRLHPKSSTLKAIVLEQVSGGEYSGSHEDKPLLTLNPDPYSGPMYGINGWGYFPVRK
jgi:hypothetical protein